MPDLIGVTAPADGVARMTLQRPEKKNALSIRLRDEVSDALDALAADEAVKVVVITFGDVVFGPLHDLVGGAVARDLCFTGRVVEAAEAKELGLVSSVVAPAELEAETARFTGHIVRAPREVLLRTKAKAIRRAAVVGAATLDL
ncbi:MAG: enoyl-CoA hydratase-related protein [Acidimicrobiia bacterium]